MRIKKVELSILILYFLFVAALIINIYKPYSLAVFLYITFFQFFIPGMVLGASFGLFKRPFTEIILYSFIISYLIFLVASLPTLLFSIEWQSFIGINVFLYLLVLAVFLLKRHKNEDFEFKKPETQELCVLALGVLILLSYTYVNYRNDATFYNHIVSASLESKHIEKKIYAWALSNDGKLSKELIKLFTLNYVQYFNFIALPLKCAAFDQRYAWLIYHKLFSFLSMLSVYCLGRGLLNPTCGYLSLFFYFVTVFPLGFYYFYLTGDIGLMFMQSAHAKQVTQNIFLFAFYSTIITAFKTQNRNNYLFAGAILLCMLSIHQLSFVYGVLNYIMFSVIILFVSAYNTKGIYSEFIKILKNGFYVASLSVVYLLYFFICSGYFNEIMYYHTIWSKSQFDYPEAMAIKNWAFYDKLKSLFGRAKILIDISLIFGIPFWILKFAKKRLRVSNEFCSMFLFSNLVLYLLLKFPLFKALTQLDFSIGNYVDALLLSCFILAFIVACTLERLKLNLNLSGFNFAVVLLTTLVYIFFGTNNVFAKHFRTKNHLSGDVYLAMTEYLNSIKKCPEGGVTVLTAMKPSVDAYAFLNAYVFQFEGATLYPYSLNSAKIKEIDELIFYPHKNESKVKSFINSKRVDYIVLPTVNTPWVTKEQAEDNSQAIGFYKRFPGYKLIYSDKYYYVYERAELCKAVTLVSTF